MKQKKIVAIVLNPDAPDDDSQIVCSFDIDGNLRKLDLSQIKYSSNPKNARHAVLRFLNTDLPYIKKFQDHALDIFTDGVDKSKVNVFRYSDAMLERDGDISNSLGVKMKKQENVETIREHFYLPGLPKLISEEYPLFKPDLENSYEYSNEEYINKFTKPFSQLIEERVKKHDQASIIPKLKDLQLFQLPVSYPCYFSCDNSEFLNVFIDTIFELITEIYSTFIYNERDLKKFFRITDSSYHPIITFEPFQSLKPIGSVGHSAFPFGISDSETGLLNQLLVHVEIVNLSLGIGEGYELYFNPQKKNFNGQEKILGSNTTKLNNFIKRFSKCVAICLNSKTSRFLMTDYYWIGVFEIEDILDGELEDIKKLVSKVKVKHFSYYNFENNNTDLTIRNIIAGFYKIDPKEYLKTQDKITNLNNRIIKEWTMFKRDENRLLLRPSKLMKKPPYIYRTTDGIIFKKQYVDLNKAIVEYVAIGMKWSCQTLIVNIEKLFIDKSYLNTLTYNKKKVLLSVYDEYYQYKDLDLNDRHIGLSSSKFANPEIIENSNSVYQKWESSIKAYTKASSLQGDVLVKVIDFGYLNDLVYNMGRDVHFKTDGYYILFDPLTSNENLKDVDVLNDSHYELCLSALNQLHSKGVTFHPITEPIREIFKIFSNKVVIINLEDTSTNMTSSNIKKDLHSLDKIFNKNIPTVKRRKSSSSNNIRSRLLSTFLNSSELADPVFLEDDEGDDEVY